MPITHAELLIHNGTIHTMDPRHPAAEAVAVADGRVLAAGVLEEVEPMAHANTRRIDLKGRTLIPGFNDACVTDPVLIDKVPASTDFEKAILGYGKDCLRAGITSLTVSSLTPAQLEGYRKLAAERRLPLRINALARRFEQHGAKIPLPERFESNWLRIDTVRLVADTNSDEQVRAMVWDVHRAGLRASISASGPDGIERAISAVEYASSRLVSRLKHRIEHFTNPTEDQLRRCRHNGIAVVLTVADARASLDKLVKSGIVLAFGSGQVDGLSPEVFKLFQLYQNWFSAELGLAQALSLSTLGGALVAGEESLKGSIVPGKYADFAVISGDPLRAPIERLRDLQVEMTLLNGQVVYTLSS